ncbi:MAG TPA: HD domain-containing phosphohydrolase [Gallionella sp.]|nr:HD domain-containing phosphohydrolase [Gallionella sp.]
MVISHKKVHGYFGLIVFLPRWSRIIGRKSYPRHLKDEPKTRVYHPRFLYAGQVRHHEGMDGGDYPHGPKDDAIVLEARHLTVADVTEAMTSHPYRPSLGLDAALAEISKYRGVYYYPDVVPVSDSSARRSSGWSSERCCQRKCDGCIDACDPPYVVPPS